VFVLDATALVALFDAYEPVFALWRRADAEQVALGIPATSIVEWESTQLSWPVLTRDGRLYQPDAKVLVI